MDRLSHWVMVGIGVYAALTALLLLSNPAHAGSSPPLTQNEASDLMMGVASSERIAKPNPRVEECKEALVDQIYIGNMLGSGKASPDELRTLAQDSLDMLGDERWARVMKLIDEAEKAGPGGLQEWYDAYWNACADGQ